MLFSPRLELAYGGATRSGCTQPLSITGLGNWSSQHMLSQHVSHLAIGSRSWEGELFGSGGVRAAPNPILEHIHILIEHHLPVQDSPGGRWAKSRAREGTVATCSTSYTTVVSSALRVGVGKDRCADADLVFPIKLPRLIEKRDSVAQPELEAGTVDVHWRQRGGWLDSGTLDLDEARQQLLDEPR